MRIVNGVTVDSADLCTCSFVLERVAVLFVQATVTVFSERSVWAAVLSFSVFPVGVI
jgi:hypothetical protein